MTKKITITLFILALFTSCGGRRTVVQDPATFDEGVVINGIRWATRNVDAPGTFAESPESAGMLFQWNRKRGWSFPAILKYVNYLEELERWECIEELEVYFEQMLAEWDSTEAEGTRWYAENDPCPPGWRVPTLQELQFLTAVSIWTTHNGVNGRLFGTAPNQIFLPAVGSPYDLDSNTRGFYWSSTECPEYNSAWYLDFATEHKGKGYFAGRAFTVSIRCVSIE